MCAAKSTLKTRTRPPRATERASRTYHPSRTQATTSKARGPKTVQIPRGERDLELDVGGRTVKLTNLEKPFWPELGISKRDLLQYYADVAPWLLPHLVDRAMVMKRYPHGAGG